MPRKATTNAVTRSELNRLRRELAHIRAIVQANADALREVRHDCATNLRRCGELQRDLDTLRHAIAKLSAL